MTFLKKYFFIAIIFFLLPCISKAQELFPLNESASSVPKGVIGVRFYDITYYEIRTQRNLAALKVMYGLLPNLSIMVTGSESNHHGDHLPVNLVTHTHVGNQSIYYTNPIKYGLTYPMKFDGFNLYAKFRFASFDGPNKHLRMALYAQWSHITSAHDEAEPNLIGDTKGYGGGLITTYLKNHLAISLTSGVIIPGYYDEYTTDPLGSPIPLYTKLQYGNAVEYNLSFGYLFYPKKYESYEQTNWNFYLEFIGKSYATAKVYQNEQNYGLESIDIQTPALKAGSYIEIHPAIQKIVNSNLRFEISVGLPMINKSYTHFYPEYMFGIQRYFYLQQKPMNMPQ